MAFLAYDAINLACRRCDDDPARCRAARSRRARADIRAATEAGADVVVVVPHWGVEYTDRPTATPAATGGRAHRRRRRRDPRLTPPLGRRDRGVGNGVVVYSLGDFIFDLPRSEQTEEGLIAELTFTGARLAQIDLHPTIELDRSQPNLLEGRDAQVILDRDPEGVR